MDYDCSDYDQDRIRLAWVSVASLVAISSQYTLNSFSFSMPPKSSGPKASWNDTEVRMLIHYLHQHRAEAGDNGNFKSSTYHSAAEHIASHRTIGPEKSAAMVRNKWVSHIRRIYQDLEGFRTKSGRHWDNTRGAGVQGKFDEEVFENYAKHHPLIWPFKNSGWEYYDLMLDIMPNGAARGTNAFTPSTSHVTTVDPDTENPPAMLDGGELEVGLPTFDLAATDGSSHPIDVAEWRRTLQGSAFPAPSFMSGVTAPDTQSSRSSAPPSSAPPSTVHGMKSGEMPPPPSSSLGKRTHSEMTGDDNALSNLPFADVSDIFFSAPTPNNQYELSAALDSARVSRPRCSRKNPHAVSEPAVAVGLQGSINLLTSRITTSMSSAVEQASTTRAQAIQLLDGEDRDLPKRLKAYVRSSIAQSLGFADVYLKTVSKEDRVEYVELEYGLKFGAGGSQLR